MKAFTVGSPSPVGSCVIYDRKGKSCATAETVKLGELIAQLLTEYFARDLKAMRRALQAKIDAINPSNFYHETLPLVAIVEALDATGFESNEFASAWIAGNEGRIAVSIGNDTHLAFTWYKMPSDKWEVVMYIS